MNVIQITHPVIKHKLTVLRDVKTSSLAFRQITEEISQFMAFEATKNLRLTAKEVQTPLQKMQGDALDEGILLVPILRAGNGMLSGMLKVLPFAQVGHIGIYRDKFIKSTVEYYLRLPKDIEGKKTLLLDPLLATGDTATAAIDRLKDYKVGSIALVCFLAAPVGIERIKEIHPDVDIYVISVESGLNEEGYILPGLGDAGDRLYDTI